MTYLSRYIETAIFQDIQCKMDFIDGPEQCGKTTLARSLCQCSEGPACSIFHGYFNIDAGIVWNIVSEELPALHR